MIWGKLTLTGQALSSAFPPVVEETSDTLPPRSVHGQAAGELAHPPAEAQHRRLHPGAGLHGESVHVRAGQGFLPRLVPNGQLLSCLTVCISTVSLLQGDDFACLVLQDLFWAVYVGKQVFSWKRRCARPRWKRITASHCYASHPFRWRPVCRQTLPERRHVFRQRGRLRLRLQVGLLGCPLRKRCEADAAVICPVFFIFAIKWLLCDSSKRPPVFVTFRPNAVHHGAGEELLSVL